MCFGTLNFVAKFFPAAKTCQKRSHEPDPMFSMPDMAVPVSFADNTFWSIKRTGDCSPALSISYAFFVTGVSFCVFCLRR